MKFSGEARLKATPEQVWAALHDPGTLARALPGCESLTTTGLDAYAVTVTAGVAAIKGTYDGRVAMTNQQPPTALTMTAQGVGGPGTVEASVEVRLAPDAAGGSVVTYDADAVVGGAIGAGWLQAPGSPQARSSPQAPSGIPPSAARGLPRLPPWARCMPVGRVTRPPRAQARTLAWIAGRPSRWVPSWAAPSR